MRLQTSLIKMPPKIYKHKLLLDEGVYPRQILSKTNSRHSIKHVRHDLKKGGISDSEVYEIAKKQKRIIITYNSKDFRKFTRQNKKVGIIGITQGLTPERLDTKLNSLLSKNSEKTFYGKYTSLSENQ